MHKLIESRLLSSFVCTVFLGLFLVGCALPRTDSDHAKSAAIIQYDAIHHPVLANAGMVVSQNEIATLVGREVLAKGGNAVDAGIATGFALAVTLPRAGNIGGSGFMLVHMADRDLTLAYDFRSAAPEAFDVSRFQTSEGLINKHELTYGPQAAGVPGTVAGFYQAWEAFGSLPWPDLLAPAIKLATEGIVVTDDLAFAMENSAVTFRRYPGSAASYLKPDGSAYAAGDVWQQPDLGWSLNQISSKGAAAFYEGELARRITSGVQAAGGYISMADLARYQPKVRSVVETDYRGRRVMSMPPPSGGGLALLQMLNILKQFDLTPYPQGSADSVHLLAEVMKRGAANRRIRIGDPDFFDVPERGFLNPELAKKIAGEIDMSHARPNKDIQPIEASEQESRDTTHFSVVDQFGNAVSATYTLGYSFGSGFVPEGTGILLDNQIRNFKLDDPDHANAIAPGKRMASSMTPTIVLDENGDVLLVTGSPGGSRIINVVLQVLVNTLDYEMNLADATSAPRLHQSWPGAPLYLEPGFSLDTQNLLKAKGHLLEAQKTMGSSQSILVKDGLFFGSADPRRPGAVALGLQVN